MRALLNAVLPPRLGSDFRRVLTSSWSTNLGDGIAAAAGPLLIAGLTDDPFLISLAALLRWAPPMSLTILIFNVTFGAAWSVLVIYATERLGLGAIGFGLLTTVSAAGGLLGVAAYGWTTRRVSLGNVMRAGLIIETLTHLGLALTTTPWVAMVIFFAFGAHAFIWGTTSITVRQRAVPPALLGRVNSINTISVFGGLVAGSAIGGGLATHLGVVAPFWFAFGGSALFVLLIWRALSAVAHNDV